ncbi:DUF4190 domain-containing protein [Streptomyces mesophilus]|uniref:DUF4190 domain-containing protein n=1 Tax=Streptomyces mesophilus TaxID=1775132 RepID=UPI00331E9DA5
MTTPPPPGPESPWAPPPADAAGPYQAFPPPPPGAGYPMAPPPGPFMQPRNGLGTAALVTGIIGLVLAVTIVLFWVGAILGVLGLVFGFIGMGRARRGEATNKGAALAGAITGGIAVVVAIAVLAFTVWFVNEAGEELDKAIKDASSSAPKDPTAEATDAGEEAPADSADSGDPAVFGDSYEYEDGVLVTVSEPKAYTPDQYAAGHEKGNKAFQFTITIENGSKEKLDISGAFPSLRDGEGADTEMIFDGSNGTKPFEGTVLPGKKATAKYAFSVPAGAEKELQLEMSPEILEYDDAIWTGSAK